MTSNYLSNPHPSHNVHYLVGQSPPRICKKKRAEKGKKWISVDMTVDLKEKRAIPLLQRVRLLKFWRWIRRNRQGESIMHEQYT